MIVELQNEKLSVDKSCYQGWEMFMIKVFTVDKNLLLNPSISLSLSCFLIDGDKRSSFKVCCL